MNLRPHLWIEPSRSSSRKMSWGSFHRARARASRCFWTTGQGFVNAFRFLLQLQPLQQLVKIHVATIEGCEHVHRFMNADFPGRFVACRHTTDTVLKALALPVGIETENGDLTATASPQAFENLDRVVLPAPFGPSSPNTSPTGFRSQFPSRLSTSP